MVLCTLRFKVEGRRPFSTVSCQVCFHQPRFMLRLLSETIVLMLLVLANYNLLGWRDKGCWVPTETSTQLNWTRTDADANASRSLSEMSTLSEFNQLYFNTLMGGCQFRMIDSSITHNWFLKPKVIWPRFKSIKSGQVKWFYYNLVVAITQSERAHTGTQTVIFLQEKEVINIH